MSTYRVTVYSKPSCMPCKMTKRTLTEGGVSFAEYDAMLDHDAAQRVRDLGYKGVPVVTVEMEDGTDHWHGYEPDKLRALVAIAGAEVVDQ